MFSSAYWFYRYKQCGEKRRVKIAYRGGAWVVPTMPPTTRASIYTHTYTHTTHKNGKKTNPKYKSHIVSWIFCRMHSVQMNIWNIGFIEIRLDQFMFAQHHFTSISGFCMCLRVVRVVQDYYSWKSLRPEADFVEIQILLYILLQFGPIGVSHRVHIWNVLYFYSVCVS